MASITAIVDMCWYVMGWIVLYHYSPVLLSVIVLKNPLLLSRHLHHPNWSGIRQDLVIKVRKSAFLIQQGENPTATAAILTSPYKQCYVAVIIYVLSLQWCRIISIHIEITDFNTPTTYHARNWQLRLQYLSRDTIWHRSLSNFRVKVCRVWGL